MPYSLTKGLLGGWLDRQHPGVAGLFVFTSFTAIQVVGMLLLSAAVGARIPLPVAAFAALWPASLYAVHIATRVAVLRSCDRGKNKERATT